MHFKFVQESKLKGCKQGCNAEAVKYTASHARSHPNIWMIGRGKENFAFRIMLICWFLQNEILIEAAAFLSL